MKKTNRQNHMSDNGIGMHRQQSCRPCADAEKWEPLFYDCAEGLADKETEAAVRGHLAECAYCRACFADIRMMTAALKSGVPEPKPGLHSRIMNAVRAEEDENGCVITETVDLRTGRVLSGLTGKRGLVGAISGVAAALILVIGLVYLMPFLRVSSGSSSDAQNIIGEMQDIIGSPFSDGVFVGTSTPADASNSADNGSEGSSFGTISGSKSPAQAETAVGQLYPIVMDVTGADKAQILRILAPLCASDEMTAELIDTDDGILVSPLSLYKEAAALLDAADLTVIISEASVSTEDGAVDDAFYIQIREP